MIGVIDYRAGNASSVLYALARVGAEATRVTSPDQLDAVDRVVLPGVGSAEATMEFLDTSGCGAVLARRVRDARVPFLGICVGLQVLFEHSEEGDVACLGWLPGRVVRFSSAARVPQIGWNAVDVSSPDPLFAGYGDPARHFYFVNSYFAEATDPSVVAATADYGGAFAAIVLHDNVMATQFHVEKSGPDGLELLRRFATWEPAGQC